MKNIDFIPRFVAALSALFLSALFVSSNANADATFSMHLPLNRKFKACKA